MIIGAHVSTSGGAEKGLENAIANGQAITAEALQIFPSAPLQWKIRGWTPEACADFKASWPQTYKQVIFHGIYLTNLAADSADNLAKTIQALTETLILADQIGIEGIVFHPGNYKAGQFGARDQVKSAIKSILEATPKTTKLVYENSAGSTIGGKLEDLQWLLDNSSDKSRVAVCLDTCHAFAAGYDIKSETGYQAYTKQVEEKIGLDKVFAWHLNDSKFSLGSKRDRHENIGLGEIGDPAFGWLMNDTRWQDKAGYLEVPGIEGGGPDLANVQRLKKLRR